MGILRDLERNAKEHKEYAEAGIQVLAPGQPSAMGRPSTLSENLEAKKAALEAQLAKVNAALDALKANPNFEEMINLLSQVNG